MKSLFLAIEGIDGSGKTTLAEALRASGIQIAPRHDPDVHARMKRMRGDNAHLEAIQSAYFEEMLEISRNHIKPSLVEGKPILADRWIASQIACNTLHQRVHGVQIDVPIVHGIAMPDVCILLTAQDELRRIRLLSRGDLSPNDAASLLPGASDLYIQACYQNYQTFHIIDTSNIRPKDVELQVIEILSNL